MNFRFIYLLVLVFAATFSFRGLFSQNLYPIIDKQHKWGFMDSKGFIKIPQLYDSILNFHENLAAVLLDNKWGYIDTSGRMVIKAKFIEAHSFNEGLALVQVDSLFGYINKNDSFIIKPQYLNGMTFSDGLAFVKAKDNNWKFINNKNNVIIKNVTHPIYDFDFKDMAFSYFYTSGILCFQNYNNKFEFYDKQGKKVKYKNLNYKSLSFSDSLMLFEKEDKIGYLGIDNKIVIKPIYKFGTDFIDGYAWVIDTSSNGYNVKKIDKQNRALFNYYLNKDSLEIWRIENLGNEMCLISYSLQGKHKSLLLNSSGNLLSFPATELVLTFFEYKYPNFKRLQGDLILVRQNNQYKYIDMEGNTIWPN